MSRYQPPPLCTLTCARCGRKLTPNARVRAAERSLRVHSSAYHVTRLKEPPLTDDEVGRTLWQAGFRVNIKKSDGTVIRVVRDTEDERERPAEPRPNPG